MQTHPHACPQPMHRICGHPGRGRLGCASLLHLPAQRLMWRVKKDRSRSGDCATTSPSASWRKPMNGHRLKKWHAVCRCTSGIYNFPSSRRDWASSQFRLLRKEKSAVHSCHKWQKDGMMPPLCGFFMSRARSLAASVVGENRCRNL